MTPAQTKALAVALDGLREAGFDEATVARMLAMADQRHEQAIWDAMPCYCATTRCDYCTILDRAFGLSPAETPGGASAHRPDTDGPNRFDEEGICRVCGGVGDLCLDCADEQNDDAPDPRGEFVEMGD